MEVVEIISSKVRKDGLFLFQVKWADSWIDEKALRYQIKNKSHLIAQMLTLQQSCMKQLNFEPSDDKSFLNKRTGDMLQHKENLSEQEDEITADDGTLFMCDLCNGAFDTHSTLKDHRESCTEYSFIDIANKHDEGKTSSLADTEKRKKRLENGSGIYNNAENLDQEGCRESSKKINETPVFSVAKTALEINCENVAKNTKTNTSPQESIENYGACFALKTSSARRENVKNKKNSGSESVSINTNHLLDTDIFECENCHMTFADEEYLTRHQVRCKNHEFSIHRCEICNRGFTAKGSLDLHVDAVHLKKKEFECNICGKLFSRKHILKVHLDTHAGIRKFQCAYCGKSFLQKSNLKRHERIHQSKNFGYKCRFCGQAFTQNKHLQNHMNAVHVSFQSV